jgi:hypothetical protein
VVINMPNRFTLALMLPGALALSACTDGLSPYVQSPDTVIATSFDKGRDTGLLPEGRAAIAYDPDGCQNWIIDDGVEGYSTPRYDPVSGLPICNNQFPPGTVIRDYQSGTEGLRDWTPGTSRTR